MFEKILIANRGEIALRVLRACREMGIRTVAVHSTADSDAMHVRLADESVCIGPPNAKDSYLSIPAILSAASITGADCIHPGYGFLSENADFAEIVEDHGITFIGPTANHIRLMGDKITAKKAIREIGIPTVPGSNKLIDDLSEAETVGEQIGFPLLIKATAGGGGRGMQIVREKHELKTALETAKQEAEASFGDGGVYIEKFFEKPNHIEIQILADQFGNVVHLGERDCSIQRRHQKVLEESPSPALNEDQKNEIGQVVANAISKLGYRSAGTVEFLYENEEFYFIEMNTRLQVEHPVTEMLTGLDMVREMIRIAEGKELSFTQDEVKFDGHAIECRINAEDPWTFRPSPGHINEYHAPGGLGVRVDSSIYSGYKVPPYYDSMISKLIVHGADRNQCIMRLKHALDEYVINGINTSIPLHQKLIREADFLNGSYHIHWLENFTSSYSTI